VAVLCAGRGGQCHHIHGAAQRSRHAVLGASRPGNPAENIIVSYLRYLAWTVWPTNLAAYYSFPIDSHFHFYLALWPDWEIGAAALLLACVSALCLVQIVAGPTWRSAGSGTCGTMVPVNRAGDKLGSQECGPVTTYIPPDRRRSSALVWLVFGKMAFKDFVGGCCSPPLTTVILAGCILSDRVINCNSGKTPRASHGTRWK